jgi:LemA protein
MKLRARVDEAWSGMDVQLKKRYELIPKLVSIVGSFAESEKNILTTVTELRSKALSTDDIKVQADVDTSITPGIQSILVSVEAYPDIKSSDNFVKLQNQFVEIEEAISYARKYYNGTVRQLNTALSTFPTVLLTKAFNFKHAPFFEAESAARNDITI